ncbi:MAG: DnaA/Hda family protein [Phycisphaerales bacterium]
MARREAGTNQTGRRTDDGRRGADALERVKRRIEREVGREGYGRYFADGQSLELDGPTLDVRVPDRFTASLIDRRFGDSLRRAVEEELGRERDVRVRCRVDRRAPRTDAGEPPSKASRPPRPPAPPAVATSPGSGGDKGARPETQTLENFVVGESNRIAHSACEQLAAGTLKILYIHGACGLGKTHLLRGVADRVRKGAGSPEVVYMTSETFLNMYTACVREGKAERFQAKFRGVDTLCLDDVQVLAGKIKTQRQALLAIEQVLGGGGRVVLAADSHPGEMRAVSRNLASRFVAGPVIRIDPPGRDMKSRLVRARAERRGLALSDAAVELISERATGTLPGGMASVRDLEGVLIQVEAVWNLLPGGRGERGVIDAGVVSRALELRAGRGQSAGGAPRVDRPIPLELIARTVCRELGVEMGDLLGKGRHKRVVLARSMVAQVARSLTTRSYPEIARVMARRNHSTVITAHQRVRRQIEAGQIVDVGSTHDGLTMGELAELLEREVRAAAARGG